MSIITVIGRGHSGTRAISHTLYGSGVYMGKLLNPSGDMVPPQKMYEACRVLSQYVTWSGDLQWTFARLHTMDIPSEFTDLLMEYLAPVIENKAENKGWKIPETTLVYPWVVRLFPDIKYIFWIRNPRDCILARHLTDDLADFGISYPFTGDERLRRAISWKYQYDLVKATPRPQYWLEVRFEDFVLQQDMVLARLETFLEMRLAKIVVRPDAVDRWKYDTGTNYFDFFAPAMAEYGYDLPNTG